MKFEYNQDTQIMRRPECAIEVCDKLAIVLVAGEFVCGRCATKAASYSNRMIFAQLNEDIKKEEGK